MELGNTVRAVRAAGKAGSPARALVRLGAAVTNSVRYDALGRVAASVDGRGNVTRTEYDAHGRRAATVDPAGARTSYAYNRLGELAAVTDALGNAVVYGYDLRGRRTYEGGATYPVRYAYDVFGNRVSMTTYRDESLGPDSGDTTRWLYDGATGAMTNKVYADGRGPSYGYDANGRLTGRTWARGVVTAYSYDGWGNLTNAASPTDRHPSRSRTTRWAARCRRTMRRVSRPSPTTPSARIRTRPWLALRGRT